MTSVSPLIVPRALEEWAPACDMRSLWAKDLPECSAHAELGVLWHNNCTTTVSCIECYYTARYLMRQWLKEQSDAGFFSCVFCGFDLPNPIAEMREVGL